MTLKMEPPDVSSWLAYAEFAQLEVRQGEQYLVCAGRLAGSAVGMIHQIALDFGLQNWLRIWNQCSGACRVCCRLP